MARILLSHSYFYYFDSKQWKAHQPYPPLGTLYAAAVLQKAGHEVILVDSALEKDTSLFMNKLALEKPDLVVLYDDGFNYLTKMCLTNMREAAFEMSSRAHEMKIPVAISSSDSTDNAEAYLQHGADAIIAGEGEITLMEWVEARLNGKSLDQIEGLIYFDAKKELIRNAPRKVLRELDTLPRPAWDLADIAGYRQIWLQHHGYFSLNFSTTRGCPFKCNWCAKPIYGNRYNSRSPEAVAAEMKDLQETYQVDHFWICDDIFGLKPNWVQQFADEAERIGMKCKYKIQSRADLMLKEDTVDALVRSGVDEVWIGAESGSQKILDAMDKGTSIEQIEEATRLIQERGRKICFFLQFGYPEETEDDIRKTIDMVLNLMPDDIGVSVSYPLPGTVFYDRVKAGMKDKHNWTDSDDLEIMYEGTFPKDYYRRLHRHVHKLYRRKQGFIHLRNWISGKRTVRLNELRAVFLSIFYYSPSSFIQGLIHRELQHVH